MSKIGNLHSQVVDEVGQAIVSGRLAAGTVLPPEATLGTEMGVSRTVAREALKSLAARGMVQARPRAGTRVLPSEQWTGLDSTVIRWRLTGADRLEHLQQLLELRVMIEPPAAALAAERADESRRQAIWSAYESIVEARDDPTGWIEAAAEMHSMILSGCENHFIASLGRLLRSAILESRNVTRPALDLLPPGYSAPYASYIDEALARYRAIAKAVRDAEPAAAEKEMRGLLLRVQELFEFLITGTPPEGEPR